MTATEIFESVTNGGASDFAQIVAVLNRHEPWCLIGGLAVNCYVEPVYTTDVNEGFFQIEVGSIYRDNNEDVASGRFSIIARNKNDLSDPQRLIIMDGVFIARAD